MRRMMMTVLGLWLGLAGSGFAQSATPGVVVELYTSQGCSSCPPADGLLEELANHDGVIALALHVDYWDYIGWKDGFGSPAYSARQKAYAQAAGSRMIYTPQMIVEGRDRVVGFRPMQVADLIHQNRDQHSSVTLAIRRAGGSVHIEAASSAPLAGGAMVQLVRYIPERTVKIGRGENAGRTMTYRNIVSSWQTLRSWDGAAALAFDAAAPGDDPVVVIVQSPGPGPILAAARLR